MSLSLGDGYDNSVTEGSWGIGEGGGGEQNNFLHGAASTPDRQPLTPATQSSEGNGGNSEAHEVGSRDTGDDGGSPWRCLNSQCPEDCTRRVSDPTTSRSTETSDPLGHPTNSR